MNNIGKGRSPFYPGQPVPKELFTGRNSEIERIARGLSQVELGKPQSVFLTGEYGIGKSSLAGLMRYYAEINNHVLGIHVFLGGAQTLEDVATKTVEAALKTQACASTTSEQIRSFLSKYVGHQEIFGVSINLDALRADSPSLSHGFLPFLRELLKRVEPSGIKGLMLILDEINGISDNPQFAHFIKALVDENALSQKPLPLMLMLCGVEERRRRMILHHEPVERIFDIVEVKPMEQTEMKDFFSRTFGSVDMTVAEDAMTSLCHYSGGFPKIMHIIGDDIFWVDQDKTVTREDAIAGIVNAAHDIGRKFVDQQVYRALRSKDYHSILAKLAREQFDLSFLKGKVEQGLSPSEKRKFNNFLQRMKQLKVLRSGDERGEYVFNNRLVRLYILFKPLEPLKSAVPS